MAEDSTRSETIATKDEPAGSREGVRRPIQKADLAVLFEAALARATAEKPEDAEFCASLLSAVYKLYNDDYVTNGLFMVGCGAEDGCIVVDYRSQPGDNRDVVLRFRAGAGGSTRRSRARKCTMSPAISRAGWKRIVRIRICTHRRTATDDGRPHAQSP